MCQVSRNLFRFLCFNSLMNIFIFHKLLSMVQGLEGLEFPYGHPWPCTVCITQWFRCCAMNGWVRTARRLLAAKAQVSKCLEDMMNFHEYLAISINLSDILTLSQPVTPS